ncbi:DUF2793 domain-containing protein [Sphingomonas sp. DT-204]|uniref:DUF2793 domain-containing protein n=1 Tax=Sphingomonas sp. DT-204 TaxID=3396166 RepID=UPI003F1A5455
MNDDTTARWALPLLAPGQVQKEMTHNEALAALDLIVQPTVAAAGVDAPPGARAEGQCWIVGDAPTGDWAGHGGEIAGWTAGGWRFVAPRQGMTVWVADRGVAARYETSWKIGEIAGETLLLGGEPMLGSPAPAIADPIGGATIDAEVRATLAEVLNVLRRHHLVLSA